VNAVPERWGVRFMDGVGRRLEHRVRHAGLRSGNICDSTRSSGEALGRSRLASMSQWRMHRRLKSTSKSLVNGPGWVASGCEAEAGCEVDVEDNKF
jgi:hypothetical protein